MVATRSISAGGDSILAFPYPLFPTRECGKNKNGIDGRESYSIFPPMAFLARHNL